MKFNQEINEIIIPEYCGKILNENFSMELKKRVTECIAGFHAFEKTGVPSIPYLAAWRHEDRIIWYEFAGKRLIGILGCKRDEAADAFQNSVVDRRIYKYPDFEGGVYKETIGKKELNVAREELRTETEKVGIVEAVYKVSLQNKRIMWLKDQARIEIFPVDKISLSPGCLTIVTKEMALAEKCEIAISVYKNAVEDTKNS